jgi:hypothetical protein
MVDALMARNYCGQLDGLGEACHTVVLYLGHCRSIEWIKYTSSLPDGAIEDNVGGQEGCAVLAFETKRFL